MFRIWRGLLVFLLLAASAVQAQTFTYTTNADQLSVTITGYSGPDGPVAIPASINSLTVTTIGEAAFENNNSPTSVTIPESVTTLLSNTAWI